MSVHYLSNKNGQVTAVQVPINEWERIKNKFPGIETMSSPLPAWQKKELEGRLKLIESNPETLKPIEGLFEELDR